MALNKAILVGRMTADPELRKTTSDVSVTSFSVAVQRDYKNADGEYDTDFINVQAWRNQAEFVCKYFGKGAPICVVGAIQTRKYEDKDGNKRTAVEVVASEVKFVEGGKKDESAPSFIPPTTAGGNDVAFEEFNDEELPF